MAWYTHKCVGVTLDYTRVGGSGGQVTGLPDYYSALEWLQANDDIVAYTVHASFVALEPPSNDNEVL